MSAAIVPLPTPTPPGNGAIKKLNFGIAKKAKAADSKAPNPVVPDPDGSLAALAESIIIGDAQEKALKAAQEVKKKELRARTTPFYFDHSSGKHDVASSVAVKAPNGECLVVFQNRYSKLTEDGTITALLGERTGLYFKQQVEFEMSGDQLPFESTEEIIGKLQAVLASYNCEDALQWTQTFKPTPDFHAKRHLDLSPAENKAIDEACPIICMVKPKAK